MKELVSVVIPVYNRGNLMLEAIDSVLAQTYKNVEVIVVDDGSTEDIEGMLKKYSGSVRYKRIPHVGHPSVGRNIGISMAKGDLLAFLDTDDRWAPQKIEEQVRILNENPHIGIVSSNAYIVIYGKVVPETSFVSLYSNIKPGVPLSGNIFKDLLFDNFIVTSSVLMRKSLVSRSGLFSTSKKQLISQDYDMWLRVAAITGFYYIPKNLAYYMNNGGLHTEETPAMYRDGMLDLFTNLRDYLIKVGAEKETVDLVNRRVFEVKSYVSLSNRDIVHALINLSCYFYYRVRSAVN